MSILNRPQKLGLIQFATGADKSTNLSRASDFVRQAASSGASIVVLPECFNSPYGTQHFSSYAEPIPSPGSTSTSTTVSADLSPSFIAMSNLAKDLKIHLIAGSIPESTSDNKIYNTAMIFNPLGELITTHRKIHLFDIDIPGGITFKESDVLSAGNTPTVFSVPEVGNIGVGICYDVRFPELAMMAARGKEQDGKDGVFMMVYPGAFNTTTGPMHWELLARARAVDNQIYVAMCSPARGEEGKGYPAYGHTMVVGPKGEVMKELQTEEGVLVVEVVPEKLQEVRRNIPVTTQRRFDVYADVSKAKP
ncbi:nitrilase, variant 1 [Ascodesmis nigricans]|uniref:Nitrilase, variant 1 n=1 Tax=Ascodesmis nigricans TaxID=341454 RepID=A0A4V6RHH3_9PEZI|nr:nitrilase, variant 1 [Ascodesmis nigricans]